MGINVQTRGAKAQLRVTHRLLPKPFFHTFEQEQEARDYGNRLLALLERGVVPAELMAPAEGKAGPDPLLTQVLSDYEKLAPITDSDRSLLGVVMEEVATVRVSGATMIWAEGYVASLKTAAKHLAPSSIRKRTGLLARVLDWHFRRLPPPMPANPFRLLPRGFSAYDRDGPVEAKRDQHRDRRLVGDEEARLLAALAGEKRPDRERALAADPEFTLLYHLIVDTGLRLREAYRVRPDQVDLGRRLLHVEGTKGHRGIIKPRTVPLRRRLAERLAQHGGEGRLFPGLWDGDNDPAALKRTTGRLSARFAAAFSYAGLEGFTEHDLRHEATCRWFTLRDERGAWVYSDIEICRIMGWTDPKLALRYASLRGEDLAARLPD